MNFYLVKTEFGNQLTANQGDAKQIDKKFKQVDIPTDKPGLMTVLNELYAKIHALENKPAPELDQDEDCEVIETLTKTAPASKAEDDSYGKWSIKMDEVFPTLPVAHQLHFASMAMENAREHLVKIEAAKSKRPGYAKTQDNINEDT